MRLLPVVAAVVRRTDGAVFAARRSSDRPSGGLWEFPGGKVEPGEDPRAALVRELREELDVEVQVGSLVDVARVPLGDVLLELSCFEARLVDGEPAGSTDHDAFAWVPLDRLSDLDWAPGDVPVIERMLATFPDRLPPS